MKIRGYVTYIYARDARTGSQHLVVSEPTRQFPGMFEKYVRLSPDNRTVTYATAPTPLTDRMKMWLVNIDGSGKRLLLDIPWELWVAEPVWSPDSRQIAYVRAASPKQAPGLELWVVNADGTGNRKLYTHPSFNTDMYYSSDPHPLSWTEYGDLQYKDYTNKRIWTVDVQTGKPTYQAANIQPPSVNIPVVKTPAAIPLQSQNDPRWRYDRIQPCGDTMGNSGCAIAAVSMSFNALGVKTDPKQLNKDLDNFACPIYWSWASRKLSYNKLEMWGVWQFDWYSLDLSLRKGRPALVWLSDAWTTESAMLSHWVLVVGGSGQTPNRYRIYDPWDGTSYKTLGYYTSKGYQLMKVYVYAQKPPKPAKPATGAQPSPKPKP